MIRLSGLVKQYGLNPVLRGVDLSVAEGEFVTLVGPNGAGKSTLMGIVATLLRPTSGEVSIGGWRLPEQAGRVRRHIGLVSHHTLLYGDLTAAENLTFFARLYRLDDAQERVAAALRKVGLFARQRDPVGTFSRGMVQRLTIARAVGAVALTVAMWGYSAVAIKLVATSGLVVAFYRVWFAVPLLWILAAAAPSMRGRLGRDWLVGCLVGGTLFGIHQVLFFSAMKMTSKSRVDPISIMPAIEKSMSAWYSATGRRSRSAVPLESSTVSRPIPQIAMLKNTE